MCDAMGAFLKKEFVLEMEARLFESLVLNRASS